MLNEEIRRQRVRHERRGFSRRSTVVLRIDIEVCTSVKVGPVPGFRLFLPQPLLPGSVDALIPLHHFCVILCTIALVLVPLVSPVLEVDGLDDIIVCKVLVGMLGFELPWTL